jgi:hypothetical protein
MGGGRQSLCFWSEIPWQERKCETVRCRDATASSFVAKVRGEVFAHFYAFSIKVTPFDLPRLIICEQSP